MVLTGTVAEVADRYRNHQCVERWYPIVRAPKQRKRRAVDE